MLREQKGFLEVKNVTEETKIHEKVQEDQVKIMAQNREQEGKKWKKKIRRLNRKCKSYCIAQGTTFNILYNL